MDAVRPQSIVHHNEGVSAHSMADLERWLQIFGVVDAGRLFSGERGVLIRSSRISAHTSGAWEPPVHRPDGESVVRWAARRSRAVSESQVASQVAQGPRVAGARVAGARVAVGLLWERYHQDEVHCLVSPAASPVSGQAAVLQAVGVAGLALHPEGGPLR